MNKRWKLLCLVSLVAVMILAIAGCGKASIIGEWQSTEDANVHLEFTQSGNLIIDTGNGIITGTYELLSDNYVKANISGLAGLLVILSNKDTWKYEVTKSDLTLSVDNNIQTFTRVD